MTSAIARLAEHLVQFRLNPRPPENGSHVAAAFGLLLRFVIFCVPALVVAPMLDWITFWRYLLTARAVQFVWQGNAETPPAPTAAAEVEPVHSKFVNGFFVFNLYDALFQLIYGPFLVLVICACILADILT
jgi:hypothetical protein